MYLEDIREGLIMNKKVDKLIKKVYLKKENSFSYLHCLIFPEKSLPMKINSEFYLPTNVYTQRIDDQSKTLDGGKFMSFKVETEGIETDFIQMYRVVSCVMIIKMSGKGIVTLSSNVGKTISESEAKMLPCRKTFKFANEGRIVYTPYSLECLDFKYTNLEYEDTEVFYVIADGYDVETVINVEIVRHIEFVSKKDRQLYYYDSDTQGSYNSDSSEDGKQNKYILPSIRLEDKITVGLNKSFNEKKKNIPFIDIDKRESNIFGSFGSNSVIIPKKPNAPVNNIVNNDVLGVDDSLGYIPAIVPLAVNNPAVNIANSFMLPLNVNNPAFDIYNYMDGNII